MKCSRRFTARTDIFGASWFAAKDSTLIVNVPGPYQEAMAAMEACLKSLAKEEGVEEICKAMAIAVYAQYPVGAVKSL